MRKIPLLILGLLAPLAWAVAPHEAKRPVPKSAATATAVPAANVNPAELIRRSEYQIRGKTLQAKLVMTIIRGDEKRTLHFDLWTEGLDKAVVKVTAPKKDRGTAHLRLKDQVWIYDPSAERVLAASHSIMRQPWMGADFSNEDLIRYMGLSRLYTHRVLGEETIRSNGVAYRALKIECTPKDNAYPGKVIVWVDIESAAQLRHEYYDEDGKLLRTLVVSNLKKTGDHTIGTFLSVQLPHDSRDYTTVEYKSMKFDQPIDESVFTQEFLRKQIED